MKAVLDVLAALDEVEWARCVGGDDPLRPPFLAWRFKKAAQDFEAKITEALKAYSGATEWTIKKGERNWVIEPVALENFARSFRVDVDALHRFGLEFPTETRTALSDAVELARHLRKTLLPH